VPDTVEGKLEKIDEGESEASGAEVKSQPETEVARENVREPKEEVVSTIEPSSNLWRFIPDPTSEVTKVVTDSDSE